MQIIKTYNYDRPFFKQTLRSPLHGMGLADVRSLADNEFYSRLRKDVRLHRHSCCVYGSAILFFILIDKLVGVNSGLTTSVICIVIILVELWSMSASMLICFPRLPFLKILKKALAGEIASKLNVRPEDVTEALDTLHSNQP